MRNTKSGGQNCYGMPRREVNLPADSADSQVPVLSSIASCPLHSPSEFGFHSGDGRFQIAFAAPLQL